MKIKRYIFYCLVITALVISVGCQKNDSNKAELEKKDKTNIENLEILGGEIVKYSVCLDEYTKLGFPIISNQKITSYAIEKIDYEEKDGGEFLEYDAYSMDLDNVMEYKGKYIYTLVLIYDYDKENRNVISFDMNNIGLKINDKLVDYKLNDVNITNRAYYTKKNDCVFEEGSVKFSGNFIGVRGQIPNAKNEDKAISGFKPEENNVEIIGFELLDYVDISNFKVNGEEVAQENINKELLKDEYMGFEYEVNYKEGVDDTNIVRTSQILKYCEKGKNRAFILTSGMYIYPLFDELGCIKKYIDKL